MSAVVVVAVDVFRFFANRLISNPHFVFLFCCKIFGNTFPASFTFWGLVQTLYFQSPLQFYNNYNFVYRLFFYRFIFK